MKSTFKHLILPALVLCGLGPLALAQAPVEGPPGFVDYQGTVFDGTGNPLGSAGTAPDFTADPKNYTMQFKIYDTQTGGTLVWAEAQTVTVSLGAFSVRLGSGAQIAAPTTLPHPPIGDVFNQKDRYLELTVIIPPAIEGTPIAPRLAFQSSPFAFVALRAKLADVATTAQSVNGPVTATAGSTFSGTVNGVVTATAGSSFTNGSFTNGTFTNGNFTNGSFSGDGSGLTGLTENQIPLLDAAKINRGILPLARGGTGSGIQNFVDLSNPQNIGGTKSFTGTVNAVNLNVGSKPAATGEESLRIVRGIVLLSGLVAGQSGAGYSVPTHSTTSTITFNPPFPFNTTPTITATAADTTQAFHTTISNVSRTGFSIATWNNSNNGQRTSFHFIAIGSR